MQHEPLVSLFTSLIRAHVPYYLSNFHLNAVSAIGDSCSMLGTAVTVTQDNCNMPVGRGKVKFTATAMPSSHQNSG